MLYITLVFLISFYFERRLKSDKKIVDEFYAYAAKGTKRVQHLADSFLVFAVLQLA